MENGKRNAAEAVKEWLSEKGYDYEVRTYAPREPGENHIKREKDKISIPVGVEDVDAFMEQFVKTFESINEVTELSKCRL